MSGSGKRENLIQRLRKKPRQIGRYIYRERKHRIPRIWSNKELAKFSHLFRGKVINVSGWEDKDKQGKEYKHYFKNAKEYFVSNIEGQRGLSKIENEIYLNLEENLPKDLQRQFDVVFNHTTLEHIYQMEKAFNNLCLLSRDIVILVVPFFQEQHRTRSYGDYWRFTPQGVVKSLKERGFEILYLSVTSFKNNSIYIFAIAARNFKKWKDKFQPIMISDGIIKNFAEDNIVCKILKKIGDLLKLP
ncbi:MAG: hypothetical protein ACETWK_02555 [Candidatus Aminicenantaceae bacterium]